MDRREFIKWIGLSSVAAMMPLPSFSEVEKKVEDKNRFFNDNEDPFWHIRKLMKERALPEWEYYFVTFSSSPTFSESNHSQEYNKVHRVFLLQNRNHHAEYFYVHECNQFTKEQQELMFIRLMHGVDQFNALPKEDQDKIVERMEKIRLYGL